MEYFCVICIIFQLNWIIILLLKQQTLAAKLIWFTMRLHTIIADKSNILTDLVSILLKFDHSIRLISGERHEYLGIEIVKCDLNHYENVRNSILGSAYVYFLADDSSVDFRKIYRLKILTNNIINACKEISAKLIFLNEGYHGMHWCESRNTAKATSLIFVNRFKIIEDLIVQEITDTTLNGVVLRCDPTYGSPVISKKNSVIKLFIGIWKIGNFILFAAPELPVHMTFAGDAAYALYLVAKEPKPIYPILMLPRTHAGFTGREVSVLLQKHKVPQRLVMIPPILQIILKRIVCAQADTVHHTSQPVPFVPTTLNFTPTSYHSGVANLCAFLIKQ